MMPHPKADPDRFEEEAPPRDRADFSGLFDRKTTSEVKAILKDFHHAQVDDPETVSTETEKYGTAADGTAGSYDAVTAMSHGWKASPRLSEFGVEYRAPSMTLRSVQR